MNLDQVGFMVVVEEENTKFYLCIVDKQAIAVHTFVLRWRGPEYILKLVVLMIWGFTALLIAVTYSFHRNWRYYREAYQFDVQGRNLSPNTYGYGRLDC